MIRKLWLLVCCALILAGCQMPLTPYQRYLTGTPPAVPAGQTTESITPQPVVVYTPPAIAAASTPLPIPEFFGLQPGSPAAAANFVQPEKGCDWMGIGGQAFAADGNPVTGLVVEVGGSLEGKKLLAFGLTGTSPALGPGGYDIQLASRPIATQGELMVQVFDLNGEPHSPLIHFDTTAECEKNLVVVNFAEVKFTTRVFFPFITHKFIPEP